MQMKMLRPARQGCRESDFSFSLAETANLRLTRQGCRSSDPLLDNQCKWRVLRTTSYWFSTFFFPHSLSFSDIFLYLPPHCLAYQREIWAAQALSCHKPSKLLLHPLWLSSDFHECGKCVSGGCCLNWHIASAKVVEALIHSNPVDVLRLRLF